MVNFNNYSSRNLPSINYGRNNVWNRHAQHAQAARDNFVLNTHSCYQPMNQNNYCGSIWNNTNMFGGFGSNQNVTINMGPSNDYAKGEVLGFGAGILTQFAPQIGKFFKNLFS